MKTINDIIELERYDVLIVAGKQSKEFAIAVKDKRQTSGVKVMRIQKDELVKLLNENLSNKKFNFIYRTVTYDKEVYTASNGDDVATCFSEKETVDGKYKLIITLSKFRQQEYIPDMEM